MTRRNLLVESFMMMSYFRRDGEALLAAAFTGFT